MHIFRSFKIPKIFMNSTIAIGNFDGVHLGHQAVINKAKKIYDELNFDMTRVNFVGHSRNTIENFKEIKKLNLIDSKTILIRSAYHMKRSTIIAKDFGLKFIPYVADQKTNRQSSFLNIYQDFNISRNLANFNLFFREIIGIIVFKLSR